MGIHKVKQIMRRMPHYITESHLQFLLFIDEFKALLHRRAKVNTAHLRAEQVWCHVALCGKCVSMRFKYTLNHYPYNKQLKLLAECQLKLLLYNAYYQTL